MSPKRTAIVTGASQGIGAALVDALVDTDYNVVATSRNVNGSLAASSNLVLVAGDIGKKETAGRVVDAAMASFGRIDLLVTNAGIFSTEPFSEFTTEDFNALRQPQLCRGYSRYFENVKSCAFWGTWQLKHCFTEDERRQSDPACCRPS